MVTRVTLREVSYIALEKTFSGTLPQWLFLQDFQPVTTHAPCARCEGANWLLDSPTLALGRVERYEAASLFRVTLAGIMGQDRVSKHGPAAPNFRIDRAAGDELFGQLSLLHPIFQRGKGVKIGKTRASSAVMYSRNEK